MDSDDFESIQNMINKKDSDIIDNNQGGIMKNIGKMNEVVEDDIINQMEEDRQTPGFNNHKPPDDIVNDLDNNDLILQDEDNIYDKQNSEYYQNDDNDDNYNHKKKNSDLMDQNQGGLFKNMGMMNQLVENDIINEIEEDQETPGGPNTKI